MLASILDHFLFFDKNETKVDI